ncbi:MAG: polysaccharide pyruvyl transferase family protein [Duncaniella sp.]|nr:polysaccharide pyruvyl transferase family protein [Muribaculum sp.]MCM1254619.1 polysaccharide pyruvyl transferase family protein [Duncaniella sp.]
MDCQAKINQLRGKISETLTPLIKNDYVLLDVPYHGNIGDVLIWEGERTFLKSLPYKCLATSSADSWRGNYLRPEVVILLHGGGNFGDLWRWFQDFKLNIIRHHPDNRIIMFPQSVWYEDESLILKDAEILSAHKDLHLCARDRWSYDFMKKHFPDCNIYLLPDMAFCISDSFLNRYRGNETDRKLYFRRTDKEISSKTPLTIDAISEVHDWPTVEKRLKRFYYMNRFYGLARRAPTEYTEKLIYETIDQFADKYVRESLVKRGAEFLASYNSVTTTRLHAMILSILLHKPVEYIDNTTGKLSAFADTWLKDLDTVKKYHY